MTKRYHTSDYKKKKRKWDKIFSTKQQRTNILQIRKRQKIPIVSFFKKTKDVFKSQ